MVAPFLSFALAVISVSQRELTQARRALAQLTVVRYGFAQKIKKL
jgi:hypothetical protein